MVLAPIHLITSNLCGCSYLDPSVPLGAGCCLLDPVDLTSGSLLLGAQLPYGLPLAIPSNLVPWAVQAPIDKRNFYPSSEWWISVFSSTVSWLPFVYCGLHFICCCGPFVFVRHVQFSVCGHLRLLFSVCGQRIQMGHVDISVFSLRAWDLGLTGRPALAPAAQAVLHRAARLKKVGWCLVPFCAPAAAREDGDWRTGTGACSGVRGDRCFFEANWVGGPSPHPYSTDDVFNYDWLKKWMITVSIINRVTSGHSRDWHFIPWCREGERERERAAPRLLVDGEGGVGRRVRRGRSWVVGAAEWWEE
jgi:hypothetical protein